MKSSNTGEKKLLAHYKLDGRKTGKFGKAARLKTKPSHPCTCSGFDKCQWCVDHPRKPVQQECETCPIKDCHCGGKFCLVHEKHHCQHPQEKWENINLWTDKPKEVIEAIHKIKGAHFDDFMSSKKNIVQMFHEALQVQRDRIRKEVEKMKKQPNQRVISPGTFHTSVGLVLSEDDYEYNKALDDLLEVINKA